MSVFRCQSVGDSVGTAYGTLRWHDSWLATRMACLLAHSDGATLGALEWPINTPAAVAVPTEWPTE